MLFTRTGNIIEQVSGGGGGGGGGNEKLFEH